MLTKYANYEKKNDTSQLKDSSGYVSNNHGAIEP